MRKIGFIAIGLLALWTLALITLLSTQVWTSAQAAGYEIHILSGIRFGTATESLVSNGWHGAARPVWGEQRPGGSLDLIVKSKSPVSGAQVYATMKHTSGNKTLTVRVIEEHFQSNCKAVTLKIDDGDNHVAYVEYVHVDGRTFLADEESWSLAPSETKDVCLAP